MENHTESHKNNIKTHEKDNNDSVGTHEKTNENNPQEESVVEKGTGEAKAEEFKEEEEEAEGKGKAEKTPRKPTDKEVKQWIKDNKFGCPQKDCKSGLGGRPYRCKTSGGLNLHKFHYHGIGEGKKREKAGSKGEDIMDEIVKQTEAADLRGKLTVAIKRITRLGKDDREVLEPELSMLKSWKKQSLKKEIQDEEINYIEGELTSTILPTLKDMEDEAKKDKQKTVEKRTTRAEDDDDDMLGYRDMKEELKMMKITAALDEARENREAARRRRDREDERRDEEHRARMESLKSGAGFTAGGNNNNQMGIVYQREIVFKHDEEGNVITGENGQPIAESMRETPMNPNAIAHSQGRGGGDGSMIKVLETAVKLVKGDDNKKDEMLKELGEDRKLFMEKIEKMTLANTTKEIYGDMNKLAGAIDGINKKLDEDPIDSYLAMQDRMKQHNISVDGSSSPEVKKIDLEIEREKTRRSMDLLMMNKTFKMAETAITKLSDGNLSKALAKKIDQGDVIAEEEELPDDDELEADIEQEIAPQQEQPPAEEPSKKKPRGKGNKKRLHG